MSKTDAEVALRKGTLDHGPWFMETMWTSKSSKSFAGHLDDCRAVLNPSYPKPVTLTWPAPFYALDKTYPTYFGI